MRLKLKRRSRQRRTKNPARTVRLTARQRAEMIRRADAAWSKLAWFLVGAAIASLATRRGRSDV